MNLHLQVCLFGAAEVSLRDALREGATDYQLEDLIRAALRNKKPQHAGILFCLKHCFLLIACVYSTHNRHYTVYLFNWDIGNQGDLGTSESFVETILVLSTT